jgi:hypothetical protein
MRFGTLRNRHPIGVRAMKKRYEVTLQQVMHHVIIVEAKSEDEAKKKALMDFTGDPDIDIDGDEDVEVTGVEQVED